MTARWSLRRFTRIDVMVAAAVCLVVLILVPGSLTRARRTGERRRCATNLSQIGKAGFLYAADYEGALPRAGGPTTTWGPTHNWVAPNRNAAFGLDAGGNGGRATISSSLYLLVKYYQAATGSLVCPSDRGTTEFSLEKLVGPVPNFTLSRAWDFGPAGESFKHSSYSYHLPYGPFALTTSRDPNLAVAADRNPFIWSPDDRAGIVAGFKPDIESYGGTAEQGRAGNSVSHDRTGQNVLFLDRHVTFERRAFCAVGQDNIYLVSGSADQGGAIGSVPIPAQTTVANGRDSVLVHDPATFSFETAMEKP